ncbi:TetR/AcrR family transcriptional regulator [Endozoicomonas euniceicola]|uniref:TetR/AcrR family transcriptional regulator n=1 Tax=Endozoicomonas euniceicola TaxID=1234143 RepID=A0ABY6GXH8_9GAMM|nr:TetR/AcrR family transcriptional regulator [Endozoicomonas euniceicola]UYM16756.1 TetR/AcrR family transcriptional regulator [Endozoicomonas euniceicola]
MARSERTTKATGKGQKKVRIILEAAEIQFALNGFRGTTVQDIADQAKLPKPNVLYYFASKEAIYNAVLSDIIDLWNLELDDIHPDDDPAESLERYIRSKVEVSRKYPIASRLFSSEIIHGGFMLSGTMKQATMDWVEEKTAVFQYWIHNKKIASDIDPTHLLFLIWGATQHYADYESQVCSIMKRKRLRKKDYDLAADTLCKVILRGCGLR